MRTTGSSNTPGTSTAPSCTRSLALAAGLAQVEIDAGAANARRAGARGLARAPPRPAAPRLPGRTARPLRLVFLQRVQRPLPLGLHGFHQPLGRVGGQRRVRGVAQRQAASRSGSARTGPACRRAARPAPAGVPRHRSTAGTRCRPASAALRGSRTAAPGSGTRSRAASACRRCARRRIAAPAASAAAPSVVLTSASTTSATPPASCPRSMSAQARRAPWPSLTSTPRSAWRRSCDTSTREKSAWSWPSQSCQRPGCTRGQQRLAKQPAQAEALAPGGGGVASSRKAWRRALLRITKSTCSSASGGAPRISSVQRTVPLRITNSVWRKNQSAARPSLSLLRRRSPVPR